MSEWWTFDDTFFSFSKISCNELKPDDYYWHSAFPPLLSSDILSSYFIKNIKSNQNLIVWFFHYLDQPDFIFIHVPCLSCHYIGKALCVLMASPLPVHWIPRLLNYVELSSSFLCLLCNNSCGIMPINIASMQ